MLGRGTVTTDARARSGPGRAWGRGEPLPRTCLLSEALWGACPCPCRANTVEFLTDPAVPPVPPHATWEQMEATAASVLKGDADRGPVVRQGLKAKMQEFLPGREKGREEP